MRFPSFFAAPASRPLLLLLAAWVATVGLLATASFAEEDLATKRLVWQDRYRVLLTNQAILKDNIAKLEHNYAQAQRRNYPRGGAREAFKTKADEQRKQLAEIEERLESIFDEARAADVPPGWLYEVEDEPIDLSRPAAPETDDDEDDRSGRNPLYLDDEDDDS